MFIASLKLALGGRDAITRDCTTERGFWADLERMYIFGQHRSREVRHQGENEELSALLSGLGRAEGFCAPRNEAFLTSRRPVSGMGDRFPVLDVVWSFPWVWPIYPHRNGTLPFSGHAFYDQEEPFRSGLLCGSASKDSEILTLGDILNELASIQSNFVVLSACETAQIEANDFLSDFLGLPGGFIVAGANAVLASLWRVEDLATSLLLGKFFELWDDGKQEGSAALAAAQQWLRNATAEELANRFSEERTKSGAERSMVYEQVADAWQRFAFDFEEEDIPYDEPMYWAAFTYTGE